MGALEGPALSLALVLGTPKPPIAPTCREARFSKCSATKLCTLHVTV